MPKFVIESDGTPDGTVLKVDGSKVNNLADVSVWADFECYCNDGPNCTCKYLSFNYSVKKKDKNKGMIVRTRYTLDPATASMLETEDINTKNPGASAYAKM